MIHYHKKILSKERTLIPQIFALVFETMKLFHPASALQLILISWFNIHYSFWNFWFFDFIFKANREKKVDQTSTGSNTGKQGAMQQNDKENWNWTSIEKIFGEHATYYYFHEILTYVSQQRQQNLRRYFHYYIFCILWIP